MKYTVLEASEFPHKVTMKSNSKGLWYWDITIRSHEDDQVCIPGKLKEVHEALLIEFSNNVFNERKKGERE